MAIVTTSNAHYNNIAKKIREMTGTHETYKPAEMPNGIEAVFEAGRLKEREGGFETVSLLTLQKQGNLTTDFHNGFNELTDNTLDVTSGKTTINVSGNVEISASISASYLKILVDGNTVYEHNGEDGNAADFEYTGKVNEKIEFEVFIARITFNRFAVDYAGASDKYYESGYADGVYAGKQAEYDAFWNAYQQNGQNTSYFSAFAGSGWNDDTFAPKYDIICVGVAQSVFHNSTITNLKGILERQGVVFDVSQATNTNQLFYGSTVTHLPKIEFSNSQAYRTFYGCTDLKSIDELVFNENKNIDVEMFYNCRNLEEIRIGGVIAKNFDIHWSKKLSAVSLNSIAIHTSTTATMTLTLPTTAEATYNAKYGAGAWAALVATRSNVTFAYA